MTDSVDVEKVAASLTEAQRERLRAMDEAIPEIALANLKFSNGDAVKHPNYGRGVVEDVRSSNGIVHCFFPRVGQYGADPRVLSKVRAHLAGESKP